MAQAGPSSHRPSIDQQHSDDSPDSDQDLEDVMPKRKGAASEQAGKRGRGKSLPKYAPPRGMVQASIDTTFKDSAFEYDRLAGNPRLQLWAIRVPADFKPQRLSGLKVDVSAKKVGGTLKHKSTTYTLGPAGQAQPSHAVVDDQGRQPTAGPRAADSMELTDPSMTQQGGDEMGNSMKLLVPCLKKGGVLVTAPLPVSQHLLLTPQLSIAPTPAADDPLPSYLAESLPQPSGAEGGSPPKRVQPSHLFKFRNRAYGFDTPGPSVSRAQRMDVDETTDDTAREKSSTERNQEKKKRKSEGGEASSKKKKVKA